MKIKPSNISTIFPVNITSGVFNLDEHPGIFEYYRISVLSAIININSQINYKPGTQWLFKNLGVNSTINATGIYINGAAISASSPIDLPADKAGVITYTGQISGAPNFDTTDSFETVS